MENVPLWPQQTSSLMMTPGLKSMTCRINGLGKRLDPRYWEQILLLLHAASTPRQNGPSWAQSQTAAGGIVDQLPANTYWRQRQWRSWNHSTSPRRYSERSVRPQQEFLTNFTKWLFLKNLNKWDSSVGPKAFHDPNAYASDPWNVLWGEPGYAPASGCKTSGRYSHEAPNIRAARRMRKP